MCMFTIKQKPLKHHMTVHKVEGSLASDSKHMHTCVFGYWMIHLGFHNRERRPLLKAVAQHKFHMCVCYIIHYFQRLLHMTSQTPVASYSV